MQRHNLSKKHAEDDMRKSFLIFTVILTLGMAGCGGMQINEYATHTGPRDLKEKVTLIVKGKTTYSEALQLIGVKPDSEMSLPVYVEGKNINNRSVSWTHTRTQMGNWRAGVPPKIETDSLTLIFDEMGVVQQVSTSGFNYGHAEVTYEKVDEKDSRWRLNSGRGSANSPINPNSPGR